MSAPSASGMSGQQKPRGVISVACLLTESSRKFPLVRIAMKLNGILIARAPSLPHAD